MMDWKAPAKNVEIYWWFFSQVWFRWGLVFNQPPDLGVENESVKVFIACLVGEKRS